MISTKSKRRSRIEGNAAGGRASRRRFAIWTAVLTLGIGRAALGDAGQNPPRTDDAIAIGVVDVQPGSERVIRCEGVDGSYADIRLTLVGPITSLDPRFAGTFTGNIHALVNTTTLKGIVRDDQTISTSLGNLTGTGWAIFDGAMPMRGANVLRIPGGGVIISNASIENAGFTVPFAADQVLQSGGGPAIGFRGPTLIKFGAPGTLSTDHLVIQVGSCGEPLDD